jgi:hypothetical protein
MSNLVKSKNMSNIRLELWNKKIMFYIQLAIKSTKDSQRFIHLKEMFEYLLGDLWWWLNEHTEKFIMSIKKKLFEFEKNIEMPESYKEYFRNVEEAFGFATYCCSNTGDYRCKNTIIKGEKNNYCEMHKKILELKSIQICEIIGSSDVSMLIAQYV